MKVLTDFASWEDAKAYPEISYSKFGSGKLRARLGKYSLYSLVRNLGQDIDTGDAVVTAKIQEICTMLFDNITCGDPLDVSPESSDGQLNRQSFEFLITHLTERSGDIAALRDEVYAECTITSYPYINVTEADFIEANKREYNEVFLPDLTERHTLCLDISQDAPKTTTVRIYQKLVKGESESKWIECAGFSNVLHSQISYQCTVPATTAEARILKAVCDFNIGMSIK